MTRLQEEMRQELLAQHPAWRHPADRLLPLRRRRAPALWLLPGAAALAGVLLLAPALLRPAGIVRLAPRVHRLAWPAGFSAASGLSLGRGRLVLFSGRRLRTYVAGQLGHLAWAAQLPAGDRALAAAAGWHGGAGVVVHRAGGVALLVESAHGRPLATYALWPPLQKTLAAAPPEPQHVTLVAAAPGWWIASDRASTWIVDANEGSGIGGRHGVVGPLAGGSGALPLLSRTAGGWQVAAWNPAAKRLSLYTRSGHLIASLPDPAAARVLPHGSVLVPTIGGVGFGIMGTGPEHLTAAVSAWFPPPAYGALGGRATPAGALRATAAGLTLEPWSLDGLPPYVFPQVRLRPLGFMSQSGAVVGAVGHQVEVVRWDGGVLAAAAVGRVGRARVGGHFTYLATRRGLVQLGPFPTPRVLTQPAVWRGQAAGRVVTLTLQATRQGPRIKQPHPPWYAWLPSGGRLQNPVWEGPLQPVQAQLQVAGGTVRPEGAGITDGFPWISANWLPAMAGQPPSFVRTTRGWRAATPTGRLSRVEWEAIQAGWAPGLATLSVDIYYAGPGGGKTVRVPLHRVRS